MLHHATLVQHDRLEERRFASCPSPLRRGLSAKADRARCRQGKVATLFHYVPIRFVALATFPLRFAFFKEGLHAFFFVFRIEEQVKTFAFKG